MVTGNVVGGDDSRLGESGSGNSVTVTENGDVAGLVTGGIGSAGKNASDNTVTVEGIVGSGVRGGYTGDGGDVSGNSAAINAADAADVSVGEHVYGGFSDGSGAVSGNSVAVSAADGGSVSVGYMSGGRSYGTIVGGYSYYATGTGAVSGNTATLFNVKTGSVFGGYITNTGSSAAVSGNAVIVDGANTDLRSTSAGGYTWGTGDAVGNTLTMHDNMQYYGVVGGYSAFGNAIGNTVTIYGGTQKDGVVGGYSNAGDVSGNTVNLFGGTYGHYAGYGATPAYITYNTYGGASVSGETVSGNTVNLFGGTYGTLTVYGGCGAPDILHGGVVSVANTVNNTVNIGGRFATDALANVSLRGGNGLADPRTGNTLNFHAGVLEGAQVADIANFEFVNIREIPATMLNGDTFIINAAGDFTGTAVTVNTINSGSTLTTGNAVTLFTNDNSSGYAGGTGLVSKGMAEIYEVDYMPNGNGGIDMVLRARAVNPSSRYLPLGSLAAAAFADRGGDLAADTAHAAATAAFVMNGCEPFSGRFTTFAAAAGAFGSQDYGSGGMDIDGFNFLAGVGCRNFTAATTPSWLIAAFFEGGFGKYKDGQNAEGDLGYVGGGLLGRIDTGGGLYAEAAVRAGQSTHDFSSDAVNPVGVARYGDKRSAYFGGHLAAGHAVAAGSSTFDFSAKYLLTHTGSGSAVILGEDVEYGSINSQRLRLGGRWSLDAGSGVMPYAGAAFEYQFDGAAAATVSGVRVPGAELKGASGIVDAGLRFRAASGKVNATVGGYAAFGKRREFGGRAFLGIDF